MKRKIFSILLAVLFAVGSFSPLGFVGTRAEAAAFRDVRSSDWYADAVSQVYQDGYMDGTGNGLFSPNETLTRAMFVTVLGRIHGVTPDQYDYTVFVDAQKDTWYGPYVSWAYSIRIVDGYGSGGYGFGSDDPISREQMATIIARYVDFLDTDLPDADSAVSSFCDASRVSAYAREGLELMRRTGIIVGDQDGNFNPQDNATRAEAATIFVRLSDALNGTEDVEVEFETDMDNIEQVFNDAELEGYADGYTNASTDSARNQCANDIFAYFIDLEQDGVIQSLSWNKTTNVFFFESMTGVLCMYELEEDDSSHFGSGAVSVSAPVYAASATQTENGTYLSSSKAIILSGFPKASSEYNQTYLDLIGILENAETRTDLDVTYYEDATVEDFKNLRGASVIAVNSHGSLREDEPVICLEENVTAAKSKAYQSELGKDYVGIYGNNLFNKGKYMIFPDFFTGTYGSNGLDGSLVHLCCCEALSNDQMSDALLAAGAETVSGYTATVTTTYDRACAKAYFGSLMDGDSVSVAYTEATAAVNGKADTYAGATFRVEGDRTVYLVSGSQLIGTVFNENMTGIAGATVTLQSNGQTIATGTTAADGSYSLPCSWDRASYTLVASADGYTSKEEVLPTQTARYDITLTRATGSMQITLKSADDNSLGLYTIIVKNSAGTTVWEENRGMSSFTNESSITHTTSELTANAEYTITATASSYTSVAQTVQLKDGESLAVEIELYRGTYGFKGKVVDDASGRPIQGIKAELVSKAGSVYGTATTDSTGSFQVMARAGLTQYQLRLSGSGYETLEDVGSGSIFGLNEPVDLGTIRMVATGGTVQPEEPEEPETDGDYTLIYSADDLVAISGQPGNYKLANDIDATDYSRSVISQLHKDAVLDGDGHTIRIDQREQYFGGLIEINHGTIRNLHVTGTATFEDETTINFGGIVGYNTGLIEDCSFDGTIRTVGGVDYSTSISPANGIGGLCGQNAGGTIRGCTADGTIALAMEGDNWYVGGVCGYGSDGSQIEDCINHASVSVSITGKEGSYGSAYAGGICGGSQDADNYIDHCLNTASIEARTTIGITRVGGDCGWRGTCTDNGNTGASIYAGYGSKPSYLNSSAYAIIGTGYTTSSTVLYDSENGQRNATETNLVKIRSASEILAMW